MSQISSEPTQAVEELWAVVPAAGQGTRLPSAYPKQYLELQGRCLLQRAVDTLTSIPDLAGVVVVLSSGDALWPKLPASQHPKVMTTIGGATRAESVVAGLKMVCEKSATDNAMVMVHDAARALTSVDDILRLVNRVNSAPDQGGLLATKVQDTLKRSNTTVDASGKPQPIIESTVSREALWQAQTPQMFRANALLACLSENQQAIEAGDITDEACAMERSGYKPALVEALHPNFKITHARDYDMALALIEFRDTASDELASQNAAVAASANSPPSKP